MRDTLGHPPRHRASEDGSPALAVEARNLTKTYRGGTRALDDLSLSVAEGAIVGLVGPNGAGKSTVIRILTTLTRPDAGSARVAGHDVLRSAARVRAAIGVVGQKHGSDPEATGWENLALQGALHGMRGRPLRLRIVELLERLALGDVARRPVGGYSGGLRRRLDLAMGLVHGPSVLFLDEPSTGLDPEIRVALWQEIRRLNAEDRLSIVFTTHYLEEADGLAQRLALLSRGRIVVEGSPGDLKCAFGADVVEIEPMGAVPPAPLRERLAALPGVGDVTVHGGRLRIAVPDGARAVPRLLAALAEDGLTAESVRVARPTLEDVFLQLNAYER